MITIKVQTHKQAAEKYMIEHLSKGDSLSEGEDYSSEQYKDSGTQDLEIHSKYYSDLTMKWHGQLVQKIGLNPSEPVTFEQFKALLENKNPITNKNLTARTVKGRRLYFDATTSAPKSVSILAVTMGDHRLIKAHADATALTLLEIEKLSQARVRINNQDTVRKTGQTLCATVTHTTSRSNDPQLHSHNLFFNVTWDNIEQKFKALEAYEIYDKSKYFTEFYRHILAQKVKELGYQIEHQKQGWEIKGVPLEICKKFSKRSQLINTISSQKEIELGRKISNNEKSLITQKSRQSKSKNLSIQQVIQNQKNELDVNELKSLEKVIQLSIIDRDNKLSSNNKYNANNLNSLNKQNTKQMSLSDNEAIKFAIKHVFERQSIVSKYDLISAAIKYSYGKINLEVIEQLIDSNPMLFRGDNDQIGSIKGLSHELFISEFVDKTVGSFQRKSISDQFNFNLYNQEQVKALNEITETTDQVYFLEGSAGTGKSYLLRGLSEIIQQNKIKMLAVAPTASASQNLENDIGVPSQTLQSLMINHEAYKDKLMNGYLIVDEAGFISVEQMDYLFKIVEKYKTQLLLVGDTKQHHGVAAGDALRSLKMYSNIKTSELNSVIRQKNLTYKSAVLDLQNRNYKSAWKKFKDMGAIHIAQHKNTSEIDISGSLDYSKLISMYIKNREQNKSTLIITPTRSEVQKITELVRDQLKLDPSSKISKEVYSSLRFTNAEKSNINSYVKSHMNSNFNSNINSNLSLSTYISSPEMPFTKNENYYIQFHNKYKNFKKNSIWNVIDKENNQLKLQNIKSNEIVKIDPAQLDSQSFDVLNKKTIEINRGESLIIQENIKSNKMSNGDLVKVKDFLGDGILLEDGRIIDEKNNFYDYGYVTTSYSSQGKTCDHVLLAMTNASGKAISAEQFYVSATRGRKGIDIFIENEEIIQSRIENFGNRTLNRELLSSSENKELNKLQFKSLEELTNAVSKIKTINLIGKKNPALTPTPTYSNDFTQAKTQAYTQLVNEDILDKLVKFDKTKSWVIRNKEKLFGLAEKFKLKIKSYQMQAYTDFKKLSFVKTKDVVVDKDRSKSLDLEV